MNIDPRTLQWTTSGMNYGDSGDMNGASTAVLPDGRIAYRTPDGGFRVNAGGYLHDTYDAQGNYLGQYNDGSTWTQVRPLVAMAGMALGANALAGAGGAAPAATTAAGGGAGGYAPIALTSAAGAAEAAGVGSAGALAGGATPAGAMTGYQAALGSGALSSLAGGGGGSSSQPVISGQGGSNGALNTIQQLLGGGSGGVDLGSILPGLIGGGLGYLANKDDYTNTTTATETIDPAVAAQRDRVFGAINDYANNPNSTYTPTGADWSNLGSYMPQVQQYLNQGTQQLTATGNPYATGDNPYLQQMVDAATRDLNDSYANTVAPKFSQGSSFGNSGLGFAEVMARDDLAKRLGDTVGGLRFQDYNLRSQLTEQGAQRQDTLNSGARNNALQAGNIFGGLMQSGNQFNNTFDLTQWQQSNAQRNNQIQALLQTMQAPGSTTRTQTTTAQGNPWLGAAGGWMAGNNLWGGSNPTANQIF